MSTGVLSINGHEIPVVINGDNVTMLKKDIVNILDAIAKENKKNIQQAHDERDKAFALAENMLHALKAARTARDARLQ
jgi:hypothetical protein